ncbi:MAG: hypothetical protein AAGE59_37385 [Cyanobacteria bacterium P01_F01_bin.86]
MTSTAPNSPVPTSPPTVGIPRPLTRVILLSIATGLLYYGLYKWTIQDELKAHVESTSAGASARDLDSSPRVWSGALCIIPFVVGIVLPLALAQFDPDVPSWFASLSFSGVIWIYIVQFRLYQEINRLYEAEGLKAPLVSWWIIVPGLNLIVGLRQIHFLSEYWARQSGNPAPDSVAERLPWLFGNR